MRGLTHATIDTTACVSPAFFQSSGQRQNGALAYFWGMPVWGIAPAIGRL